MRVRAILLAGVALLLFAATTRPAAAGPASCTVDHVIDGDTFVCRDSTHVRLLQINAPELSDCGGAWSKAALGAFFLPAGRTVRLDYDRVTVDRYGRTLAAPIWRGNDGADYNLSIVMVYVGLARAAYYGDNAKYLDWANASENWARVAQWNMWAPGKPFNGALDCGSAPPAPPPPSNGNCDPAYPDVCIPSPPPDLDCGQISYRRFRVLPPDPHGFDGDHDGIGCES